MKLAGPLGFLTPATVLDPPVGRPARTLPVREDRLRFAGAVRAPRRGRRRWLTVLVLVVPSIVAAVLCSYELSTRSLWLDEGATVSIASQHGAALWHAIAHDGGNMLIYYLVVHVLIGLFGDAEVVIRTPSVLASVVTVATVGVLGLKLFDRRLAFAAGILMAISLPLVFWGQDARAYAPLVTFCALSFLAFHELVTAPTSAPSRWWLAAYIASTVLAVYMGFVGALVLPAQLLLLAIRPRHGRWLLAAMAGIIVACFPLLVLASVRGSSQLFWVPRPNMEGIGQTLRWLTSSGMPPNFHRSSTATLTMVISIVVLFSALVLSARRCRRALLVRRLDEETWGMLLVVSWLVIPIGLSVAESATGQPILLFRNAVICLPPVALAMAWVLLRGREDGRTYLAWAAVGGLVLLRALQLAPSYGVSPENWKAAEHYVSEHTRPGDCIAFYPLDGRMPFDYYVRAGERSAGAPVMSSGVRLPRPVEPAKLPWSSTPPFVEDYQTPSNSQIRNIEKTCPRLWFVASHEGQRNGPPMSKVNFVKYRVLGATLQLGYRRHHRVNFGWAAQIEVELLSGRQRVG